MKHVTTLLLFFMLVTTSLVAQHIPMGMKYQAVARDPKGQVLADRSIQLKISLYAADQPSLTAYSEIHKVTTNALGLFSLTIGEGLTAKGSFEQIPWSSHDIWMTVAIQLDDETEFITISDSRMLSVPYAFHAATAGEITGEGGNRGDPSDPYTKYWHLQGNLGTYPGRDKLGTGDMADLVIVTNNTERIRVTAEGDVDVVKSVNIGRDLAVAQNVYLNTDSPNQGGPIVVPQGETFNYGNFTVESESKTYLTGTLTVDGATKLNDILSVEGATDLQGTLDVFGATQLHHTLEVDGTADFADNVNIEGITHIQNTTQSNATDAGALIVDGGVGIAKNLYVGGNANFEGTTTFGDVLEITSTMQSTFPGDGALVVAGGAGIGKNLNVGGMLGVRGTSTGFMASIQNMDGGSGDGLEIKLGKTHPAWDGSAYINVPNPGAEFFDDNIATIRGWIEGEPFEFDDVLGFVPAALIAGTTCGLVEKLAEELNDALGLPKGFPGLTDAIIFDAFNSFADPLLDDDWRPDNPTTIIPGFTLQFPTDFCPEYLPSFSLPNINFVDVNNSLKQENQFLSFKDKDNRELGSIRALSVTEWGEEYFDGTFLVNFIGNTVSLDPLDIVLSCVKEFTSMADNYNQIGVEYASGHGDYAEWLERMDPAEIISRGDIVAVKGGKITKDLSGAEQVMAVSAYPIVLGNLPDENQAHLGNNVAFMGQIPVKIMGPVKTGDYIVANSTVPGYGIAKPQDALTLEDMLLVVGRAWETKPGEGPKMVNTVVGVHNGDYFRILQKYEQKLRDAEDRIELVSRQSADRMESLEARVDMLMERLEVPNNKLTYQE